MKIAGIICEYNPFHNGHAYQIKTAKNNNDAVVCVMSGSFVQRGSAAVYDKWTRAHAALKSGADLVIELPVRYCLSSAQGFARGAVEILCGTGVIDTLVFGSECGDIKKLLSAADILLHEPPEVSAKIQKLMTGGVGYATARAAAYDGIIDADLLSSPNNVLGIEYLAAIARCGSSISPQTHTRTVGYHDDVGCGNFAAATHIRDIMNSGSDISAYVPFDYSGHEKYDTNKLTEIFRYKMITEGSGLFRDIADTEIGLENRFLKSVNLQTFDEIADFVSSKRHTKARVRRIMLCALLNLRGGYRPPEYIRVLGMTGRGREILAKMRKTSVLPIINKTADFGSPALTEDVTATNLSALCADTPVSQNRDYLTSPIIVE